MTTITLESGQFGWDYLLTSDDGRDVLIQTDWDYPGVASTFGWSPSKLQRSHHSHVDSGEECEGCAEFAGDPCEHDDTDGTIDCPCGVKANEFIAHASEWLDDHIGDTADDPEYFGDES